MPFDVERALAWLAEDHPGPPPEVRGVPAVDLIRSPAAAAVGRLAAAEGLFAFHFEHRHRPPTPAEWVVPGEEDDEPIWEDGAKVEPKYGAYRHDLLLASFHPSHRSKWTAHELAHGLVGFAWRPGASPLWQATAARLAELLPVTLWYFLEEVRRRRCADHAGAGPLHRAYCRACELASAQGPRPVEAHDRRWLEAGRAFFQAELDRVAETCRVGRPIAHRSGNLDLCSDGLAYARSHGRRLSHPALEALAEGPWGLGRSATLEALAERSRAVLRAVVEGEPLPPRPGASAEAFVRQDLAMRMLELRLSVPGSTPEAGPSLPEDPAELVAQVTRWAASSRAFSAAGWLAVGYPLAPGVGSDLPGLEEGLRGACPVALDLVQDAEPEALVQFAAADPPRRAPLGERFAAWLGGPIGDLARFETVLRTVRSMDDRSFLGPGEGLALAPGVEVQTTTFDVVHAAERAEAGELRLKGRALVTLSGRRLPRREGGILLARDPSGELILAETTAQVAAALARGEVEALPGEVKQELASLGLLVPQRWPILPPAVPSGEALPS